MKPFRDWPTRIASALALTLVLHGGCTNRCKKGTVLLSVTLEGAATGADTLSLDVVVANGSGGERTSTLPLPSGSHEGTVEIDFSTYPAGEAVAITVTALHGTTPLGAGSVSTVAAASCDALNLTIGPPVTNPMPELSLLAGAIGGPGSADDVRSAARLYRAEGLAADWEGNLYVADSGNQVIRKIELSTGIVSTFAGMAGMSGNQDGTGAEARFSGPSAIVLGDTGNLYVTDTGNGSIRKIELATRKVTSLMLMVMNPDGTVSMPAANQFGFPLGLAFDGQDTLYVGDTATASIRQISLSTKVITDVAYGVGEPIGLALSGTGKLYALSASNNSIQQILLSTKQQSTLALTEDPSAGGSTSMPLFNHPFGIAVDGEKYLYVADRYNDAVRKVELATGKVTTVAGVSKGNVDGASTTSPFQQPSGIIMVGGNLYVGDNSTVQEITLSSGAISIVAGAESSNPINLLDPNSLIGSDGIGTHARFNAPSAVAADGASSLYVAEPFSAVRKIVFATSNVSTLVMGDISQLSLHSGATTDGQGNLFIADWFGQTINKVILRSGQVSILAGSSSSGSADGKAMARFNGPADVTTDGMGALYVADQNNNTIRKVVISSGEVSTIAGTAGMAGSKDGSAAMALFNSPGGVVVDGAGTLYVADSGNHTIRTVALSDGGTVDTLVGLAGSSGSADGFGSSARFNGPSKLALDGHGNLFVVDSGNYTIRKVDIAQRHVTTYVGVPGQAGVALGPLPARLNSPSGIAVLPDGTLIITDSAENAVLAVH